MWGRVTDDDEEDADRAEDRPDGQREAEGRLVLLRAILPLPVAFAVAARPVDVDDAAAVRRRASVPRVCTRVRHQRHDDYYRVVSIH